MHRSKTDQATGTEKVLAQYPTINRLKMGGLVVSMNQQQEKLSWSRSSQRIMWQIMLEECRMHQKNVRGSRINSRVTSEFPEVGFPEAEFPESEFMWSELQKFHSRNFWRWSVET